MLNVYFQHVTLIQGPNMEDPPALRPMNYVEIYQSQIASFKCPVLLNHQVKNGVYLVKARYLDTCLRVLYIYTYYNFRDQMQLTQSGLTYKLTNQRSNRNVKKIKKHPDPTLT